MPQPHRTVHRLRFNDTDRLGHVNNAVFAVMLEQGRTELVVEAGLPVGTSDRAVVLVRLELDFLREMAWPGEVEIETWVARIGQRSMHVRQRLLLEAEECGRARTVLCILDRATGRAAEIESAWRESLAHWLIPDAEEAPKGAGARGAGARGAGARGAGARGAGARGASARGASD